MLIAAISCGGESKETTPPAAKENDKSQDSSSAEGTNIPNIGLGNAESPVDAEDDVKRKLHEFAENKCKCGQIAFKDIGDIDKIQESDFKKIKKAYVDCIGQHKTGEILKIMNKSVVDSYMLKNCPQVTSTLNRIKNRF